ncbi:MAG: hypothetical protein WCP55_11000, partial [Lentisphaerota bacterium]
LWSGGTYDGNNYDAYKCLPEVREKLFGNDISGAWSVLSKNFRYAEGVKGWGDKNQFGCYQVPGAISRLISNGRMVKSSTGASLPPSRAR